MYGDFEASGSATSTTTNNTDTTTTTNNNTTTTDNTTTNDTNDTNDDSSNSTTVGTARRPTSPASSNKHVQLVQSSHGLGLTWRSSSRHHNPASASVSCLSCTCWWYSLCTFQYRQHDEQTCSGHFDC